MENQENLMIRQFHEWAKTEFQGANLSKEQY